MSLPQPVPPSWKDLGKSSNDLLGKDYYCSGYSLEVKTNTPSFVSFKVTGVKDSKSQNINGDIEAKYADKKNGLTFTQTWTTSNVLRNVVELENQIAKGLKLDLSTSLNPEKNDRTGVVTAIYKQSGFHTRAVLDLLKGPTFTADTVLGRDGFLLGAEAAYNVTVGKVTRYAAAVGYNAHEYAATICGFNNFNTFSASYYHKINRDVEAGAKAIYDTKATHGGVALEVGGKASLDSNAFIKGKINNNGIIALAYTQQLKPGVQASVGLALDTIKLSEESPEGPVHKVGMHFVFES